MATNNDNTERDDLRLLQVLLPAELMRGLDHLRIDKDMTRKAFIELLIQKELLREAAEENQAARV